MKAEDIIQINLMNWVREHTTYEDYIFHIANERTCSPQEGRRLKRMGVMKGVSDLFVAIPRGEYHGMFLELKTQNGAISPHQYDFLERMEQQGYRCAVAKGYTEARALLAEYLGIALPQF